MTVFSKDGTEKTEVTYDTDITTKIILEFLSRANKNLDIYADNTWPSVSMGIDVFKRAIQDIKKRTAGDFNINHYIHILSENERIIYEKIIKKIPEERRVYI